MGRTLATFNTYLEQEMEAWRPFRRALRREDRLVPPFKPGQSDAQRPRKAEVIRRAPDLGLEFLHRLSIGGTGFVGSPGELQGRPPLG